VDTYLRRIYEKLEVGTRTGAVAKALREKIV
jgi:DNA-binding CsgD family transcriptional regulator